MNSPEIQNLARQLIASEAVPDTTCSENSGASFVVAVQVIEKLRLRLIKLAGVDGFSSLLSRALAMAKVHASALQPLSVCADGSLAGVEEITSNIAAEDDLSEKKTTESAGTILVASLLKLLMTFIGESLTLGLVRDAWPDASMTNTAIDRTDWGTEDKP
jgi:hypothetical protein